MPPGAVGIFSFSFYELWEEKLRPLEIDGQTGDRCVFPSEETISSELYPLERTIRLYTTARSLRRPEVQTYIKFHLEKAKDFAAALGLIPVPETLLDGGDREDPQAGRDAEQRRGAGRDDEHATTDDRHGPTATDDNVRRDRRDHPATTATTTTTTTTSTTTGERRMISSSASRIIKR